MEDEKFNSLVTLIRRALTICGFDILNEEWRLHLWSLVTIVVVLTFPLSVARLLILQPNSLDLIAEGFALLITDVGAMIALLDYVYNRKHYRAIMEDIRSRRYNYVGPEIDALFDESFNRNIFYVKFLYTLYISSSVSYLTLPFVLPNEKKFNLPLPGILPFLSTDSPFFYFGNIGYHVFVVIIVQHIFSAQCSILVTSVISCCCQIDALKIMVVDFGKIINDPTSSPRIISEAFTNVFLHHSSTKDFIAWIQRQYAVVYLSIFLVCGGIVTTCLSVLSEQLISPCNFLMISGFFSALVHCYFGNALLITNDRLPDVVYEINWEELPVSKQKDFKFFLANSQLPAQLDGMLLPLTMNTFIQVGF
ncbi:uncharacterized protein LOC129738393 [Uranotaenia lowii]|uniref:uncharacterized protein LOC129738393 n=1 Tax=Uranotaenia lowii TaxID=190385 RepID=UPI002479D6E8|nr:uncharacterized protein LOC129738393 [Uranotaenia lowii]